MNKNLSYKNHIKKLFLESTDKLLTTSIIVKDELNYELSLEESKILLKWIQANLRKDNKRHSISLETKIKLYNEQNGKCIVCGEDLGKDWSKIHVDHIIPWVLVGDELENNYQDLCNICNESKSASTDYIFKSLINLT